MPTSYEKLSALLKELFQLDQADLDFGIYRSMNQKRDEIEKWASSEITSIGGEQIAPKGTPAINPAKYIIEEGIAYPPYLESLAVMVAKAEAKRKERRE